MTNTPDYRGVFLRGYGNVTSTHFGITTHSSESLGILQGDSIRNIVGKTDNIPIRALGYTSGAFFSSEVYATGGSNPGGANGFINFNASLVVPTSNENRPINKAVHYLIKAK